MPGSVSDAAGETARAFRALGEGDLETLERLISADPKLLARRDALGRSLVLYAVYAGQPTLAWELVRRGAPEEIHEAAALGDRARVDVLLKRDPDSAARFSPDGWTPLHLAAFFGHPEVCAQLLKGGAPMHAVSRNTMANQPIHAGTAGGHVAVVEVLVERGAEPSSGRSPGGFTPLHLAASGGDLALIEALLAAGAEVGARDEHGRTPVDLARRGGHDHVVELLLHHGARELQLTRTSLPAQPSPPSARSPRR